MATTALGKNIKEISIKKGLKLCAVAKRAQIPEQQFYAMVSGRKIITGESVPLIAKALGVTPNALFKSNSA